MILIASVEQDFRTFVSLKIELTLAYKRIESFDRVLMFFACSLTLPLQWQQKLKQKNEKKKRKKKKKPMYESHQ